MIQEGEEEEQGLLASVSSWTYLAASHLVRVAALKKKPSELSVQSVVVPALELLLLSPASVCLLVSRQVREEGEGKGLDYLEVEEVSLLFLFPYCLLVSVLQHFH